MSAFSIGQLVGRYRILRQLGAGAMGDVYLAEDPRIERRLAIKAVRLEGGSVRPDDRVQRMVQEAKAVGRLIHPNIVTLFDVGEEGENFYLAFEYVAGTDLAARLRAIPPLSLGEALHIARQAAAALQCAHQQGVIHRDIKPSNLLLDEAGNLKVADFGIAKLTGQTSDLTVTGSVVGSPHYMSPEQVRGEELDGRSDLFSLGTVLYEMVGGRRPFEGGSITTLIYQILHHQPPPPPGLPADSEPLIGSLLERLLAKDRDQRFASAEQLEAALTEARRALPASLLAGPAAESATVTSEHLATHQAGATAPPLPVRAPSPGVRPRRRRWVVPALIAGAAGLILTLALLTMNGLLGGDRKAIPEEAPAGRPSSAAGAPAIVSPKPAESDRESALGSRTLTPREAAREPSESPTDSSRAATRSPSTPRQETGDEALATPVAAPDPVRRSPPERRTPARDQDGSPAASSTRLDSSKDEFEEGDRPRERLRPRLQSNHSLNPPSNPSSRTRPTRPSARIEADRVQPFAFDRKLETGMTLLLDANPEDAFVVIDGFVIGRANEVTRRGGHTLAQPGEHRVVLRSPGMREYRLLVNAAGSREGTTRVKVEMERAPVSELALGDLPRYLVREGIGFRVQPKSTRVVIDGQVRGPAFRFSGRAGRWLPLPRGTHRVSLVAPGHVQVDIAVEVGSGATEKRQLVRLNLPPERP